MGGDERQGDGMLRLQARSGFGKGRDEYDKVRGSA
jgi:hypothetical protein